MRKPTASSPLRPVLLCAALALGAGCASTKPRDASPTDGTPPSQAPQAESPPDASTPEQAPTGQAASPWQRARVGDRVTYSFSAHRVPVGDPNGTAAAGVVTLEVVAVEAPWVWLAVSFAGDGGKPLTVPPLSRTLVLPMRSDETLPLEVTREGEESSEQPTAAGRTWEAKRYLRDGRAADGPLENRLYAVDPGPLYLTNGLLDGSTTMSGFGTGGSTQLTLMEVRQGSPSAGPGTKPRLEHPLGPGTWSDMRSTSKDTGTVVQRFCTGAERGHLLYESIVDPPEGGEKCPGFSRAQVKPLEEELLSLIWNALAAPQWPPPQRGATPAVRETATVKGQKVPALRLDTQQTTQGVRELEARTYPADPWDPVLAGLSNESRFLPLATHRYRTPKGGKRELVDTSELVDWGIWLPGAKP